MFTMVLTAIGGILVARFLGPEITGAFRAYTIPLTYLIFLHLGTWDGLWRQIPYFAGKGDQQKVERIAASAGSFNLVLSGIVSTGFLVCAIYNLIRHDYSGFAGWFSQAINAWSLFYGGYLTSTYRTLNNFVALSKIQAAQAVITFVMVFSLPFLEFYGLCARVALPAIVVVWLYHKFRPLRINYHFNVKELLELIRIGLPLSFWGSLYTSFWVATESTLMFSLAGVIPLGFLSVAVLIREAINTLPRVIRQVFAPRVISSYAQDGSIRGANHRVMWVTVGLVICMVILAFAGTYVLDVFVPYFIPKYIDGIPIMKVCLWFSVVEAALLPINIIFATGKAWLYGRSVLIGIIVFPMATLILIPMVGNELAVVIGSLLGRAARTIAAYIDLVLLTRGESRESGHES